jgi:hypothetical protein
VVAAAAAPHSEAQAMFAQALVELAALAMSSSSQCKENQ